MAWPKGVPKKKAAEAQPQGVEALAPSSIDAWLAEMEEKAQALGLVVVNAAHPDAEDGKLHPGKYSGIRLSKGEAKVQLNSGEWL